MARRLGRDGWCRYVADDPKGIGVRCRVEGEIESMGGYNGRVIGTISDNKKYLVVLDGGAVRIASGNELKTGAED